MAWQYIFYHIFYVLVIILNNKIRRIAFWKLSSKKMSWTSWTLEKKLRCLLFLLPSQAKIIGTYRDRQIRVELDFFPSYLAFLRFFANVMPKKSDDFDIGNLLNFLISAWIFEFHEKISRKVLELFASAYSQYIRRKLICPTPLNSEFE